MKKIFFLSFSISLILQSYSQTEKFDIASFIPPQGWQRSDSNGVLLFHDYKTKNNLTSFGQIILYPSQPSTGNATANFNAEWNNKVTQATGNKAKPTIQTETTPDGWIAVTGFANITQSGLTYMKMLVTATGFGRSMSVVVNTAGNEHATAIEKFFNGLELDGKAATALSQSNNNKLSTMGGTTTFSEYAFIAPPGWFLQNNKDYLSISQSKVQGQGCLILMFPSQPSSGNIEADAKSYFDQMYPGWSYRNTGEKKYNLIKGYTSQDLEYCMMEASMSKLSADGSRYDGFEDGCALAIKNGNRVGIIIARHNTSLMEHDACRNKYETWLRFLNSINIKYAVASKPATEQASKKIIGVWELRSSGPALGNYVFAANGSYELTGGVGTSTTSKDSRYEYLHLTSYAFQGDGSYSINGSQLKLMNRGGKGPELVRLRFDKVSHGGGAWNDRIHLLKGSQQGAEYEVCYERIPTGR